MISNKWIWLWVIWISLMTSCQIGINKTQMSGNPILSGWYADPEGIVLGNEFWIYPTYSATFDEQTFIDAFSSIDLIHWKKYSKVLSIENVSWAKRALWAPAIVHANNQYYLFFAANDIQNDQQLGGIGVATASTPYGPFKDALGKPLIGSIVNGAQPIDQFVFKDDDGQFYMYYGGWGHCNIVKLASDLLSLVPFDDGTLFKEVTPQNYVEGPCMLKRNGKYYFMWSEGSWTGPDYCVSYAIADSPLGPFEREGIILKQDERIARGAGHHSVIKGINEDEWYMIYHRRPLKDTEANHRVTCIDRMYFDKSGKILPVKMTMEGVERIPISEKSTVSGLFQTHFQMDIGNKRTGLYTLRNDNNMEVCVTNYGARIVSVMVPDKNGLLRDVVLGFDSIQDYLRIPTDFGATIGRYANRIAQGRFVLDGKEYQLVKNNYGHCLHGGKQGFHYQVWDAHLINSQEVKFTYYSKDGEENFPGNLNCSVWMKLTDDNAIEIRYEAETDKPTVINMTNHSYFNLDGDAKTNTFHQLMINADYFTPVDSTFMTTGEIVSVERTPMDFRTQKAIGERIDRTEFNQLKYGLGYDHNWVLNTNGDLNQKTASLKSDKTGIVLDVYTTEPGLQMYAGNFLDGSIYGKKGIAYNKRASVCLETQKFPDSPNKLEWPSCVLRPDEKYTSCCIYRFSVEK